MNIFITGGTGFVGRHLCSHFLNAGHSVTVTGTRAGNSDQEQAGYQYIRADTTIAGQWQEAAAKADLVVNLAGRTIFKRWSRRYKQQIRDSRLLTTRNVVEAIPDNSDTVLMSASAVGYYGDNPHDILTEASPVGNDFLSQLAKEWEAEAQRAADKGVRVVLLRFGIVMGLEGGALAAMLPAFRRFAGGPVGSGRQWIPWIHIRDVLAAISFLFERSDLQGAFNFCAPEPVSNRELAQTLGKALGRPAVVPAPALALKIALGELAQVLLSGQRAVPARLLDAGYDFVFKELDVALADLLSSNGI